MKPAVVVLRALCLPRLLFYRRIFFIRFERFKQLTAEERYELRPFIEEKAIDYAVGIVDEEGIDTLNILWASVKAMHIAVSKLKKQKPQLLLVDGNRFKKYKRIPHRLHC